MHIINHVGKRQSTMQDGKCSIYNQMLYIYLNVTALYVVRRYKCGCGPLLCIIVMYRSNLSHIQGLK